MKSLLLFLLAANLCIAAQARLGETNDQCIARYGVPTTIDKTRYDSPIYVFVVEGIQIKTWIGPEGVDKIQYQRTSKGKDGRPAPFTRDEINALISVNFREEFIPIHPGVPENENWTNRDYTKAAILVGQQGRGPYFLEVLLNSHDARLRQQSAEKGKAKLLKL